MSRSKGQRSVIYVRMPAILKRRMVAEAKRRGVSLNELAQEFLDKGTA